MKIKLLLIGKNRESFVDEGYRFYKNRVLNYLPFEDEVIPPLKGSTNLTPEIFKLREGSQLLRKMLGDDFIVLLDERGKSYTSERFAGFLQQRMNTGIKTLTFVTGGAFGFSEEVYQAASAKMSLSAMTFPHQLVRVIFMEQLYRAMTILRNEPYHNA
jgi:23S rRNA (pseudouridine1915-N3)-methyltransferase